MTMTEPFKLTDKEKWRHLQHFMDTHNYSKSNVQYLWGWVNDMIEPPKQLEVNADGMTEEEVERLKEAIRSAKTNPSAKWKPDDDSPRTKKPINIEDIGLTEEDAWEFEQDFLKWVDKLAEIDE